MDRYSAAYYSLAALCGLFLRHECLGESRSFVGCSIAGRHVLFGGFLWRLLYIAALFCRQTIHIGIDHALALLYAVLHTELWAALWPDVHGILLWRVPGRRPCFQLA